MSGCCSRSRAVIRLAPQSRLVRTGITSVSGERSARTSVMAATPSRSRRCSGERFVLWAQADRSDVLRRLFDEPPPGSLAAVRYVPVTQNRHT
jgi:hypothetical protein